MPNKRNHRVSTRPDGKWAHQREGSQRASGLYDTQREARDVARQGAIQDGGELLVQRPNGQIRERNTYGNDPYPPKG